MHADEKKLALVILEQFPDDNFAMSLLEQLEGKEFLTGNQLDYILGEHNPSGGSTFQKRCNIYRVPD